MKRWSPFLVAGCAFGAAMFALFGDDSFANLRSLRNALEHQQHQNRALQAEVRNLRREVNGLQTDDRILEKTARNELGMARHGELIFIFDQYLEPDSTK